MEWGGGWMDCCRRTFSWKMTISERAQKFLNFSSVDVYFDFPPGFTNIQAYVERNRAPTPSCLNFQ